MPGNDDNMDDDIVTTANLRQPFLGYTDDPDKDEARRYVQLAPRRGNVLPYLVVAMVTSLVWSVLILVFVDVPMAGRGGRAEAALAGARPAGRHNVTTGARLLTCGQSAAAARARGCRYDLLLNNWVPGACYDNNGDADQWVAEYQDDGSWAGFADEALTQPLTAQAMSERVFYWTSVRDHVNHCAMMWRKQFWALYEERPALDTVIASPGHTDHCAQFLIDASDSDRNWTQPTRTEVGFAGCWVRDRADARQGRET